jgi:hypothetical protein
MAKADWIAIEAAYRGGTEPVTQIAAAHGITEGAIRKMVKKHQWQRDPEGLKRERVKAFMAGGGTKRYEPRTPADMVLNQEAEEDARDMRLGLQAARLGLQVAAMGLKNQKDAGQAKPGETKLWSDCVALNITTIRRIRGLDEKQGQPVVHIERSYGQTN